MAHGRKTTDTGFKFESGTVYMPRTVIKSFI